MIIEVKYFYEKTDEDYEKYNELWTENKDRLIFIHTNLSYKQQLHNIIQELNDTKDILAFRFPEITELKQNKIMDDILFGKGIEYDNKTWYPKEIWIYCPI